jgi:hypothetical protein
MIFINTILNSEFYQKRAIPYKSLRFKSGLEISPKLGFYSKP